MADEELARRFEEIFGTTDHVLHQNLQEDLERGIRTRSSVLADLEEAAVHRMLAHKES